MLFGGLARNLERTKGAVVNYVFLLLHGMRKEGVADIFSRATMQEASEG